MAPPDEAVHRRGGAGLDRPGEQNERWYAARDLSAFNRSLVNDAFAELRGDTSGSDDAGALHASYEQKIKAGRRIERTQQDRPDGRIRGASLLDFDRVLLRGGEGQGNPHADERQSR
ncbi:hypothetical protein ACFU9X_21035 [Streptomyces atratus]|uniref:hypothetical protein n=1 Tax=Streptomyces atratus TaxID=1893 RepID=UPI0036A7805F